MLTFDTIVTALKQPDSPGGLLPAGRNVCRDDEAHARLFMAVKATPCCRSEDVLAPFDLMYHVGQRQAAFRNRLTGAVLYA